MKFFESVKSSGSGTVTNTINIPININNGKKVVIQLYLLSTFLNNTKMSNVTGLYLPDRIKLKGKENYQQWKEKIVNIAKSNQLGKYINDKCIPPLKIDEFNPKADQDALKL
jgi:hypothetical protein